MKQNLAPLPRYTPHRTFPPYAFIPGQNLHPEKKGGHYYGVKIQVSKGPSENLEKCKDFYYGIDLFNHGYPWEAHVWWEALWNLFGRTNAEALFLQALIKLAAAKVKLLTGHPKAAQGHHQRALEILQQLETKGYRGPKELKIESLLQRIGEDKTIENLTIILVPER